MILTAVVGPVFDAPIDFVRKAKPNLHALVGELFHHARDLRSDLGVDFAHVYGGHDSRDEDRLRLDDIVLLGEELRTVPAVFGDLGVPPISTQRNW